MRQILLCAALVSLLLLLQTPAYAQTAGTPGKLAPGCSNTVWAAQNAQARKKQIEYQANAAARMKPPVPAAAQVCLLDSIETAASTMCSFFSCKKLPVSSRMGGLLSAFLSGQSITTIVTNAATNAATNALNGAINSVLSGLPGAGASFARGLAGGVTNPMRAQMQYSIQAMGNMAGLPPSLTAQNALSGLLGTTASGASNAGKPCTVMKDLNDQVYTAGLVKTPYKVDWTGGALTGNKAFDDVVKAGKAVAEDADAKIKEAQQVPRQYNFTDQETPCTLLRKAGITPVGTRCPGEN